jgi:flagellar FliL protein
LSDTSDARYLRMTVSLGMGESETPEKPNPLFTTKVRNAMISVLTTKTSEQVLSADGKAALRKELLEAARSVSDEPQVIAIYITDFIVQL